MSQRRRETLTSSTTSRERSRTFGGGESASELKGRRPWGPCMSTQGSASSCPRVPGSMGGGGTELAQGFCPGAFAIDLVIRVFSKSARRKETLKGQPGMGVEGIPQGACPCFQLYLQITCLPASDLLESASRPFPSLSSHLSKSPAPPASAPHYRGCDSTRHCSPGIRLTVQPPPPPHAPTGAGSPQPSPQGLLPLQLPHPTPRGLP